MWTKVTWLVMSIGFLLDLWGFAIGTGIGQGPDILGYGSITVVALLVTGFICFFLAAVLALLVTFIQEVQRNCWAKSFLILFALAAGVLTIAGIGVWGQSVAGSAGRKIGCYCTLVAICGSVLALLAALFTSFDMCGCRSAAVAR